MNKQNFHIFISEKYDLIGRLLRPGEEPADYTDTEEEHSIQDGSTSQDKTKTEWFIISVL